jgi:ornithine decarboxylase
MTSRQAMSSIHVVQRRGTQLTSRSLEFTRMRIAMSQACPSLPQSFFTLDLGVVRRRLEQWRRILPQVTPYYAIKANPHVPLVQFLSDHGVNFDCATRSEMQQMHHMNISSSRLLLANPCKNPEDVIYGQSHDIPLTTFDADFELHKIHQHWPRAQLLLRLWVDDTGSQRQMADKYGANLDQLPRLLKLARRLRLTVRGTSFHVGSGASVQAFGSAMDQTRQAWQIATKNGYHFDMLDVGGGFPGLDTPLTNLHAIAAQLRTVPLPTAADAPLRTIAEPGRYFCAEAQSLVIKIIGRRQRDGRWDYYVNNSLYSAFSNVVFDHAGWDQPESIHPRARVFGHSCDGHDLIADELRLPELQVGDYMVFSAMGAYTNASSSNFNGLPTTPCYVVS